MKNFSSDVIWKAAPIEKWMEAMEQTFIDTVTGVVGLVIQGFHDV